MEVSEKYSITIEKLINIVHTSTCPIRIEVIMRDAWLTCDEAHRMHDFYLIDRFQKYRESDKKAEERLMKYYKDVPVWNLTAWIDDIYTPTGNAMFYGIEARCYYKDIREGWLAEQNDIKRERRKAYRKAYNEKKKKAMKR